MKKSTRMKHATQTPARRRNVEENRSEAANPGSSALGGARTWLALGTIAASAAMNGARPATLWAQSAAEPQSSSNSADAQVPSQRFDINAGPLDDALAAFRQATHLQLQIQVPAETIPGFRTQGVHGMYTPQQALDALLADTGLSAKVASAGTFSIGIADAQRVEVEASQIQALQLQRYPVPLLETPKSINVISQQIIQQQNAVDLRDTLRNSPGISLAAGEGGAQGDSFTLRGFTARNDIFLDGMRDFGSYYRDSFNYEQVDVLEGPSSVTFGRGSTGGVVNQESKAPREHPFIVTQGNLGTDITRRLTADINEPIKGIGPGAAFRLNFMGNDSNVAARDVVVNRRYGVAPTLALGLGTPTRFTAGYYRFSESDIPDYGIPWYYNTAASQVQRSNYYGFRSNYLRTDVDIANARIEHDLGSASGTSVLLRDQGRYAHYIRHAQITEPQLKQIINGLPQTPTALLPIDQLLVNRNQIAVDSVESFLWDQLDGTVHIKTGPLRHSLVAGLEGGKETSDPVRPTYNITALDDKGNKVTINSVPYTDPLHPNEDEAFSGTASPSSNVHATSLTGAMYALDTVEIGRRWDVTGGIRWDYFNTDYKQTVAPASIFSRLDKKATYRAALVYKPTDSSSVYFDYGTSFNPSAETIALSAATVNAPPETNKTLEVGGKVAVNGGRFTLRTALFRTDKDNAREPSVDNPLLNVLGGSQRVDGAELAVQGHITSRWELLSSYTYMHSEVTKSKYYPLAVGAKLANVPDNLFNLWTTYRLPRNVEVGGGSNFVDSRTASSTVPNDPVTNLVKQVPSYLIFSAMAKYPITERMSVQANVYNLTNRNFVDQIHPGHLVPGAGASALFGLNYKF